MAIRLRSRRGRRLAEYLAYQPAVRELGPLQRSDDSPVPKDRSPVGDLKYFLQAVGDVEDRLTGLRVAAQRREQQRDLSARELSGGLVQHQHPIVRTLLILECPGNR